MFYKIICFHILVQVQCRPTRPTQELITCRSRPEGACDSHVTTPQPNTAYCHYFRHLGSQSIASRILSVAISDG